jgi:DNA replication protein DnaC
MTKLQSFTRFATQLNLSAIGQEAERIIQQAQDQQSSYLDFGLQLMQIEIEHRDLRAQSRKLKAAKLPIHHQLDQFDCAVADGITPQQLKQLRELLWLDQNFNLILMGPCGVGKTFLAAGLAYQAIEHGYTALFRSMQEIIDCLKLKDITRSAQAEYKRITRAQLLVIDDMMMFPVDKQDANLLFHLINRLHQQSSLIITTNKGPQEWTELLDDQVLAAAILDRLLFQCQIIQLNGTSYRMTNRKTIFEDDNNTHNES